MILNDKIFLRTRGVQPGITPKEIERAIRWGYEHGEEGGKMPEKRGHRDHKYNINACLNAAPVQMPDTKIDKEDEKDENEVIDETCGPIPGPIFSTLPQSLKNLLVIAKNDRERDVILLSCITILSGIFHSLRTMYGNKKYSAHLYMCFLAGSGSGKGVAMYATLLGKPIHNELVKRNKAAKREFENKLEDAPDITGVIFRTGLIVLRVAMVLCGLRILESGWQIKEYTCTDEDFDTAMKIVLTCMNHTLNTSTMMEEGSKRHKLTNYYKLLPVLRKMNNRFKYSEFKLGANDIGIGDTSVKRALKKYIITGLITKHYEGYEKTFLGKTCI